jgi:hypothetical protein
LFLLKQKIRGGRGGGGGDEKRRKTHHSEGSARYKIPVILRNLPKADDEESDR